MPSTWPGARPTALRTDARPRIQGASPAMGSRTALLSLRVDTLILVRPTKANSHTFRLRHEILSTPTAAYSSPRCFRSVSHKCRNLRVSCRRWGCKLGQSGAFKGQRAAGTSCTCWHESTISGAGRAVAGVGREEVSNRCCPMLLLHLLSTPCQNVRWRIVADVRTDGCPWTHRIGC
jgi:hypothetical protein